MGSTHDVQLGRQRVRKTFRSWARGEHEREWATLNLLHAHVPGLAPRPLERGGDPPWVEMSRLPGEPLGDAALTPHQVDAVAAAITTLHRVPVIGVPTRLWRPSDAVADLRAWCDTAEAGDDNDLRLALGDARRWLDGTDLDDALGARNEPVLGQADGNLANHLWDGAEVHLVDFEDAGASDRAFELADLIEHVGSWVHGVLDPQALLERCDLSPAERTRTTTYRRAMAVFWLLALLPGGSGERRNPAGTRQRAVDRVDELLACTQ